MKVEIELSELESLRSEIKKLRLENLQLDGKLKELDEKELKKSAVRLAYHLADCYLKSIFKKLGFNASESGLEVRQNLEQMIGKNWFDREDELDVAFGVGILNEFKRAFISIGVQTKVKDNYDYDLAPKK